MEPCASVYVLKHAGAILIKLSEKEKIELEWWKRQSLFGKKRNEKGHPSKRAYNKYLDIVSLSGGSGFPFDDKVIIDVGCGPMGALHYFPQTSVKVGIDNLAYNYNHIFQIEKKQDVKYITADAELIPISSVCVDCIFCINSLDHVDKPNIVLDEFERILRPGGIVFLQVEIDKNTTTLNEPHSFSTDSIINLFKNFSLLNSRVIPKQKIKLFRKILKLLNFYPRYEDLFVGSFLK